MHQVIVRYGCQPALQASFPDMAVAANQLRRPAPATRVDEQVDRHYKAQLARLGLNAKRRRWAEEVKVRARLERGPVERDRHRFYRVRIWLEGAQSLAHVNWVEYDLHPEYGAVSRRAVYMKTPRDGQQFRHWINTRDDYWIRVRASDGSEMGVWLSKALEQTDDSAGTRDCIADLIREAQAMRGHAYRERDWADHVEANG